MSADVPSRDGYAEPGYLFLTPNSTFLSQLPVGDAATFVVKADIEDVPSGAELFPFIHITIPGATEFTDSVAGTQVIGSTASGTLTFNSILDAIEALYVGYFASPGDLLGIGSAAAQYFSGTSLQSIAASFATQAAAIAEYPFLANPQSAQINSFVNSVYQNLFQRAPTSAELMNAETTLTANLGNSQFIDTFIYNTILSAQGQDQTTIENQIGTAELTLYPQNDYLAITRTALPVAQATTIVNEIIASTTTEAQYVSSLLNQAVDTTIPAVAVEASMYGVTGSSDEITKLVTQVLPAQVATAIQNGSDPVIAASEALGLQFAFADENGGTGFANNYGPSNAAMPATTAGDTAFAAAAASTVFGSSAAANWSGTILGYVTSFEAFYTANGIPGITNPSAEQIDLAARGAAWGEAIGTALVNNLGPFGGETANFLEDAAQGTAIYSASLSSQPAAASFQGGVVTVPPFGSPAGPPALLSTLSLDQQMELIYIGYFNRSADAGGFSFWEGQNATAQAGGQSAAVALTNIANSFTPQAETEVIYPFLSNPHPNFSDPTVQAGLATFIGNVYENLFDRAGDSGGVGYWAGQIESGAVGLGASVLAIANGAQGSDAIILQNKIAVALDFTNLTSAANVPTTSALLAEAKTVLAGVDGMSLNDASVTAAEALIAPWIANHPNGALVAVVGSAAHFELT